MNLMRFTIVDSAGAVSFVYDGSALNALLKACADGTASLMDLLGSTARRDANLREFLRSELAKQQAPIKAPLADVVEAADTVQIAALRKDALLAVDELKTKGSDSRRNLDFWGQVGVGAVALGCVSAAALGAVAVGIPCVIGGSASQGLLSFWEKQQ